ncbi:MAG: hypothetical protein DLM60_03090 [Pseudonocardiales bacterium]|nr:MAG: hypothetical protein DLM60_03090 [Pseudonocardiales bacterium]
MVSSLQTVEVSPVAPREVVGWLRHYDWGTMPGKLRVIQVVLVLGLAIAGAVGVYAAIARVSATVDIAEHLEPLNANVTTLYRSLADADATVAAGYLSGGLEPTEMQIRYGRDIEAATASLAQASTQTDGELVTAKRIADITSELPTYTGLVERARVNNRQGLAVGVSYLRRASDRMQDAILPAAAELQRRQATRLDDAYHRAGSVHFVALAVGGISLAGLIWAQAFLFQRTHRVFNIGLVTASGALLAGLAWWTIAGVVSTNSLDRALGHSQSVSDALAPAQIAALQARAVESLELVTRTAGPNEPDFDAQMQLLDRDNGAGGALGAAQHFATDQQGVGLVREAVTDARDYVAAHRQVRQLDDAGDYTQAVDAAVNPHHPGAAATFDRLDLALTAAADHERAAFTGDIGGAHSWLTGLPIGTGGLALVAVVGVTWGVQRRLEEYR